MDSETPITPGMRFRHYKGGVYAIVGLATHTETDDELVLYQADNDDRIWARPTSVFRSKIDVGRQRFTELESG